MIPSAWQEFERVRRRQQKPDGDIDERIGALAKEADNLATAIARGGNLETLVKKLVDVAAALQEAREEKARFALPLQEAGDFNSCADCAARLARALLRMAQTSFDFADLLRRLLPAFVMQPVQALDRPQIRPRAKLTLRLDAWTTGEESPQEASVTLDLFGPPVHVQHLAACGTMKQAQPKASLQVIAAALGINHMTVKRALAFARLMAHAGLTEPYRELHERPEEASRSKK